MHRFPQECLKVFEGKSRCCYSRWNKSCNISLFNEFHNLSYRRNWFLVTNRGYAFPLDIGCVLKLIEAKLLALFFHWLYTLHFRIERVVKISQLKADEIWHCTLRRKCSCFQMEKIAAISSIISFFNFTHDSFPCAIRTCCGGFVLNRVGVLLGASG